MKAFSLAQLLLLAQPRTEQFLDLDNGLAFTKTIDVPVIKILVDNYGFNTAADMIQAAYDDTENGDVEDMCEELMLALNSHYFNTYLYFGAACHHERKFRLR